MTKESKKKIKQVETHFSSEEEARGFMRGVQYMDQHGMWVKKGHFFEKSSGYWAVEMTMDSN